MHLEENNVEESDSRRRVYVWVRHGVVYLSLSVLGGLKEK